MKTSSSTAGPKTSGGYQNPEQVTLTKQTASRGASEGAALGIYREPREGAGAEILGVLRQSCWPQTRRERLKLAAGSSLTSVAWFRFSFSSGRRRGVPPPARSWPEPPLGRLAEVCEQPSPKSFLFPSLWCFPARSSVTRGEFLARTLVLEGSPCTQDEFLVKRRGENFLILILSASHRGEGCSQEEKPRAPCTQTCKRGTFPWFCPCSGCCFTPQAVTPPKTDDCHPSPPAKCVLFWFIL